MGKISVDEAVYKVDSTRKVYNLQELRNLYFESREKYEEVKANLVCPNCEIGKVFPRKISSEKFIYATFHDTHDMECDYFFELQTRKQSETAYTEDYKNVISKLNNLFGKLLNSEKKDTKPSSVKQSKSRENSTNETNSNKETINNKVIGQKNLKFELNEDDYNRYKIFYGIITLDQIQETQYFYNIVFKGHGKKSTKIRMGIYKGIYDELNIDLYQLKEENRSLAISVVGKIERNEIYKTNQLKFNCREDIQIQGVENKK